VFVEELCGVLEAITQLTPRGSDVVTIWWRTVPIRIRSTWHSLRLNSATSDYKQSRCIAITMSISYVLVACCRTKVASIGPSSVQPIQTLCGYKSPTSPSYRQFLSTDEWQWCC